MNLFIDVDGVILGKINPSSHKISLAYCADDFFNFAIEHFKCYWLTTHCKGDTKDVLDYLSQYTTHQLMERLSVIKPTNFSTLKTEALFGNYLWIDDSPLHSEIQALKRNNNFHRWLKVNTYRNPYGLCSCLDQLRYIVNTGFSLYQLDP
jgi:hypothetical protein